MIGLITERERDVIFLTKAVGDEATGQYIEICLGFFLGRHDKSFV